tara:strand:+ start:304 stop:498 length:195 start_codon:yes stop_codon:yes gene_type:complete
MYNYLIFGIGLFFIMIGYILMSLGDTESFLSTKLSPIILLIGYCILIPVSLMLKFKKRGGSSTG